jgi:hypothetical protein
MQFLEQWCDQLASCQLNVTAEVDQLLQLSWATPLTKPLEDIYAKVSGRLALHTVFIYF